MNAPHTSFALRFAKALALCSAPLLLGACATSSSTSSTSTARANDFPTADRVLYVQECIRTNRGSNYEMVSKCSCALDKMAAEVTFDDYVTMTTIVNAITIGGERGGELRDNETVKPQIARYRELQSKVQKSCFIGAGPK